MYCMFPLEGNLQDVITSIWITYSLKLWVLQDGIDWVYLDFVTRQHQLEGKCMGMGKRIDLGFSNLIFYFRMKQSDLLVQGVHCIFILILHKRITPLTLMN